MWNHITQTLQLVSLARGLMSLWKCATHSSLGNFSCTDERGGERDVGTAIQWKWHIVTCTVKQDAAEGGHCSWMVVGRGIFITSSWIMEGDPDASLSENPPLSPSSPLQFNNAGLPGSQRCVSLWAMLISPLWGAESRCVNRQAGGKALSGHNGGQQKN